MKVLVTGAGGFVGPYLSAELRGHAHEARTTDIRGPVDFLLDLLDADAVHRHFTENRYDAVVHLAGFASVAKSWEKPKLTLELNTFPLLYMLDALSVSSPHTRVLVVGSADQYGTVPPGKILLDESDPCFPQTPYAISKHTQERLALCIAASRKLNVVLTRSFNHIGPGQEPGFVVPDFASAIARIMGGAEPVIHVGNTQAYRDFTDVRDIVCAYRLLIEHGKSGEVYNVGSGLLHSIQYILDTLIALSGLSITVEPDAKKMRPIDTFKVGCCNAKIHGDTGWEARIPIEDSLKAILDHWTGT